VIVLGLESSCDETAAALVEDGTRVLADVVASQNEVHERYGGVVPELASRAHVVNVVPVLRTALDQAGITLDQVGGVGVTSGPGLIGALLVAVQAGKALAWARGLPLVGVHHLEGHLSAVYLEPDPPPMPHLALIVSGGHTSLVRVEDHGQVLELGRTRDDAAGEAFDKGAKLLGLGYPGGVVVDRLARTGDPAAVAFPRGMIGRNTGDDFSFSGLKTALLYAVRDLPAAELEHRRADLAASYQRAIVEALVGKTLAAAETTGLERIAIVGGVAANSELRQAIPDATPAPLELCTDNAAMIASAARYRPTVPYPEYLALDAYATAA
jgi:N6-L-threonylcarbamoyladenine synthase